MDLRIYSAVELHAMLRDAGFEILATYGSFTSAPYDHKADRLIVLAGRPS